MAVFSIEIAGIPVEVHCIFDSTRDYCRNYRTERAAEITLRVSREELPGEQEALRQEALEEGLKPRTFSDPFLERSLLQKKLARQLLKRNILLLHGSTLAIDGNAYLFTAAKCGTGKSTHTRLWREVFGSRVVMINDDKPFLQISREGVFACGAPWSGKHGLDTNLSAPLKGICILERSTENRIGRTAPEDAMTMLLKQSFPPDRPEQEDHFRRLVGTLARTVPLWRLQCTKDPSAARMAYDAMTRSP